MKYGLYYCKETPTLGDDFWAYAQSLFYPHIDYLIDNTTIYKFKSVENELVATIVSAFVEPRNREWCFFPPSNILPFFIGSYFRSTMWEFIDNEMVSSYLRAYEPIGIRSKKHISDFKKKNITAYDSGCITLTLPQFEKNVKDYICCVDVPDSIIDYIREAVGDCYEIKVMSHELWRSGKAEYLKHCEMSIEERFRIVQDYLQIYASAHCVITTKLHCALPCLTQHTPVLLTFPKNGIGIVDMEERMGSFFQLLHLQYFEDFLQGHIDFDFLNPPANSNQYIQYCNEIRERVNNFISYCENDEIKNPYPYSERQRLEYLVDILEKKVTQLKSVIDYKNDKIREIQFNQNDAL